MKPITLFTLLTVAGAAACNQSPLSPTQSSASKPLSAPSAAAPASGGASSTAPSSSGPSAAAPAAAAPTDGSDCVQEGENTGQCGSQVEDGLPDGTPETPEGAPETGAAETPGTETTGQ